MTTDYATPCASADDALRRRFRDMLAVDQARESLRREAAVYVLLRVQAAIAPQAEPVQSSGPPSDPVHTGG